MNHLHLPWTLEGSPQGTETGFCRINDAKGNRVESVQVTRVTQRPRAGEPNVMDISRETVPGGLTIAHLFWLSPEMRHTLHTSVGEMKNMLELTKDSLPESSWAIFTRGMIDRFETLLAKFPADA